MCPILTYQYNRNRTEIVVAVSIRCRRCRHCLSNNRKCQKKNEQIYIIVWRSHCPGIQHLCVISIKPNSKNYSFQFGLFLFDKI